MLKSIKFFVIFGIMFQSKIGLTQICSFEIFDYAAFSVLNTSTTNANLFGYVRAPNGDLNGELILSDILSGSDVNHVATDFERNRIIFSHNGDQGSLFAYNFAARNVTNIGLQSLADQNSSSAGAAFHKGKYYFFDDADPAGSDQISNGPTTVGLFEITFDSEGMFESKTRVDEVFANPRPTQLGDLVVSPEGIVYIATNPDNQSSSGELWKFNLNNPSSGYSKVGNLRKDDNSILRGQFFIDEFGRYVITNIGSRSEFVIIDINTGREILSHGNLPNGDIDDASEGPNASLFDFGDAPDSYQTLRSSNGPLHIIESCGARFSDPVIRNNLVIGSSASDENEGKNSADAGLDQDDANINFPPNISSTSTSYTIPNIRVTNKTNQQATFCGWVDFDNTGGTGDGTFETDERACATVPATGSSTPPAAGSPGGACTETETNGEFLCSLTFMLSTSFNQDFNIQKETFARFRLASIASQANTPAGVAQSGEVEDYLIKAGTLPVTLSMFKSRKQGTSLDFNWKTDTEQFNLGFNLWIKQKGHWKRVNEVLIPGVMNSAEGKSYRERIRLSSDMSGDAIESVAISSLSTSGDEELYGPYALGKTYGFESRPEPIDWNAITKAMDKLMSKEFIKVGDRWLRDITLLDKEYEDSSTDQGLVGEIVVKDTGMVNISHAQLLSAGIDLNNKEIRSIALSRQGEKVAVQINNSRRGRWNANSSIVFYSTGLEKVSFEVSELVYQLSIDLNQHLAMGSLLTSQKRDALLSQVKKVNDYESQAEYAIDAVNQDPWIAKAMYNYLGNGVYTYDWHQDLSDVDGGKGVMKLDIYNRYDDPALEEDGMLEVYRVVSDGEEFIGSALYQGLKAQTLEIAIEGGLFEGANHFRMKLKPLEGGDGYTYIYIDIVSLEYDGRIDNKTSVTDRFVISEDDTTAKGNYDASALETNTKVYAVLSADSSVMQIHPRRGQLEKLSAEYGEVVYHIIKEGGYVEAKVNAVSTTPASLIDSGTADYLIISHPLFTEQFSQDKGAAFIAAKQQAGHNVKVVNYSDVIQHTGYGESTSKAIKTYIESQKQSNTHLKYVMLIGSACRDNRDYTGNGCINMIPTNYVSSTNSNYTPSDFTLGDVDGDGYADVIVGRLPARTQTELDNMLNKMLANEARLNQGNESNIMKALMTADRKDINQGLDFSAQQNRLSAYLAENTEIITVFEDEGQSKAEMISALNNGADVWSYSGHSSFYNLGASASLFGQRDAVNLTNQRYPLVLPMACYMTYSVHENINTLSYQLMNTTNGVSGMFGSSVLTSFGDNETLQRAVFKAMNEQGLNLGEAILSGQHQLQSSSSSLSGANLMGDPALRLN